MKPFSEILFSLVIALFIICFFSTVQKGCEQEHKYNMKKLEMVDKQIPIPKASP